MGALTQISIVLLQCGIAIDLGILIVFNTCLI